MVLSYAPLLREEIASAKGLWDLKGSKKTEAKLLSQKARFPFGPSGKDGEFKLGRRRVLEKYERRGNKFVTFRVEAINPRKGVGRRI
ncbi:MAG: hypothetical protein Ct9H300mP11_02530 [Chloroflexota bacterium]|nr:MAG: hypothetical protein Ct9H300mP11_02530 [Chloroflexota bacterium]